MIHGPYVHARPNSPCMKNGKCSKKIPKIHQQKTIVDQNDYPIYKKRSNGNTITKTKFLWTSDILYHTTLS